MGLKLRYSLFRSASAKNVHAAFRSFYRTRGSTADIDIYHQHNGWTAADLHRAWAHWPEHREALRFVSRSLGCPAFLVFVFDGDYWGYEFVADGDPIDHFVQWPEPDWIPFPGEDGRGHAERIVERLPFLRKEEIAPYLVQRDMGSHLDDDPMDVPARPGDEFRRFDECAVLDFLRMLGVDIQLRDHYVTLRAARFRSGAE